MDVLTNTRSERVRSVRSLGRLSARRKQGLFLAEGPQSVREAVAFAPEQVRDLYVDPLGRERQPRIVEDAEAAGIIVRPVSTEVLAAMTETEQPQGLLAVCRLVEVGLDEALAGSPRLVAVLSNVRDPGNAGTVIRCADAAGADAVLITDSSVDLHNPKLVRSTAGSLWHLPIARGASIEQIMDACRPRGLRLLAADGAGEVLLPQADLAEPTAWVFGNEAWGLEQAVRDACDEVVRVPIHGHAESLNLAMAATVCLYASAAAHRRPEAG